MTDPTRYTVTIELTWQDWALYSWALGRMIDDGEVMRSDLSLARAAIGKADVIAQQLERDTDGA